MTEILESSMHSDKPDIWLAAPRRVYFSVLDADKPRLAADHL